MSAREIIEAQSHADLAKEIIRRVYALPGLSKADRHNEREVALLARNDSEIANLLPADEDEEEAVMAEVARQVNAKEDRVFKSRATKFKLTASADDPAAQFRVLARGKTWMEFKRAVLHASGAAPNPTGDGAENIFDTAYNAWRGATFSASADYLAKHPLSWRLSDARVWADARDGTRDEQERKSGQTEISRVYFGGKAPEVATVYRGVPRPDVAIKPGDYCTLDRGLARAYAIGPHAVVLTEKLPAKDLIVAVATRGVTELVYWPEGSKAPKREDPPITLRQVWDKANGGA